MDRARSRQPRVPNVTFWSDQKPWLCLLFRTANCQLARVLLQLAFVLHSSGQRNLSQRQNTMTVKDRSGLRPAAQSAKRHLLKWIETSSKPWLCLLFCAANCQLARVLLQLAFVLHSSGQRTFSQHQNTMAAVKEGPGPRPAAQSAKRHLLKWLESSSKPWLCLLFCTANCQLARVLSQLAFVLHSSGQRTFRSAKTPWQRRTDQARGRQPRVPNVTFWTD